MIYFLPFLGVIIAQLSSCDRIRHMEQCTLVLLSQEVAGEVLISDHSIYFVENSTDETKNNGVLSITIQLAEVREYHLRWWQVKHKSIVLGAKIFFVLFNRYLFFKFQVLSSTYINKAEDIYFKMN